MPQQVIDGFAQASSSGSFDFSSLTGVGDLGAAILKAIPPQFQAAVQPFIGAMVEGVHGAFSLATAQTFWLGVVGSIVALGRRARDQGDPAPDVERAAGPGPDDRRRRPRGARSAKPEPVSASTAVGD